MNNETNTMNAKSVARNKSNLSYAIKTKVISHKSNRLVLENALHRSTDWTTFKKSDFLYKQLGYVAGAEFNMKTGEFHLILRQDGSIERRVAHPSQNWM
jgi:penicillin V acylase-like amidase (Ntn superfamily)